MKIVRLTENYIKDFEGRTVVAIGKFDGIHRGHEKLLGLLREYGRQGYVTCVFSFESSLNAFFSGEKASLLTTEAEKEETLRELGVDILANYPVNSKSVAVLPEDFVRKVLCSQLGAGIIISGPDCSFGARGAGDLALLEKMGAECDFRAICVEKVTETFEEYNKYTQENSGECAEADRGSLQGCQDYGMTQQDFPVEISSTYVRQEIVAGHMEHAAYLLGKPYSIEGTVVHGRKLGRTMSMPTVNIVPESDKLLPPFGVYFSKIYIGTAEYSGITNVGRKPTVNDTPAVTAETYIYDFDDDLYGENLKVELLKFARPEMKFESVEALKTQMAKDLEKGRRYAGI